MSISIGWSDITTDSQKKTIIGTGSTNAVTDSFFFTAKLYDTHGNLRTTGGDIVNAWIYSGTFSVGSSWVTDNDDGTYKVEYQVDLAGTYTAMVVVNGDTANNKTSTVTLIAGDGDPQLSILSFSSTITIRTSSLSIVAKDKFGNLITSNQVEIAYELIWNHGLVSGNVPIQTLASAFYDAIWIISIPTSTSISGWGSVGVNAYFLLPELNSEYFSNRWFALTPALVQRETQVNVDWGTGNILSFASDYVSVRWSGFLKPTYSEDFTFVARVNDGARITIGDTKLIDKLDELVADGDYLTLTSSSISLIASSYVPIIV